jgi:MoxR-like ATPase
MTAATATKPATSAPVLNAAVPKLIAKIQDEGQEIHFERLSAIQLIWTCLFARMHPFLLGPPGTNKTRLIDWVCRSIDGASFWEVLCNNQLGLEDFFGPIDMVAFNVQNKWHRDPTGYMPTADVIMLDEVFKANGSVLNPMLDFLVRFKVKLNGSTTDVPALMVCMASNEMPAGDDLGAFWDRRGGAIQLGYMNEEGNVDKLFQLAAGDIGPRANPTTIPLADVQHAIFAEVPSIIVPSGIRDALRGLKSACEHPTDGGARIVASDRRWGQLVRLCQAAAYLAGRDVVDDDDLSIARFFLWETPESIPLVEKRVMGLASPQTAVANEVAERLDAISAKISSMKGQSLQSMAQYGAEANGKIRKDAKLLEAAKQDAMAAGRSTTRIDEISAQLSKVRVTVMVECLGVPIESAERA